MTQILRIHFICSADVVSLTQLRYLFEFEVSSKRKLKSTIYHRYSIATISSKSNINWNPISSIDKNKKVVVIRRRD